MMTDQDDDPRPRGPLKAVAEGNSVAVCDDAFLSLHDARTGRLRWRRPLSLTPMAIVGPRLYAGAAGNLLALDMVSGKEEWESPGAGDLDACCPCADVIAVVRRADADHAAIDALDPRDGTARWTAKLGEGAQVLAMEDEVGVAEVHEGAYRMRTLNGTDGRNRWTTTLAGLDEDGFLADVLPHPLTDDSLLISVKPFGEDAGWGGLIALDRHTGRERWRREMVRPGAVHREPGALFVAGYDATLYALDAASGRELWTLRVPGPADAITVVGGALVVSVLDEVFAYQL